MKGENTISLWMGMREKSSRSMICPGIGLTLARAAASHVQRTGGAGDQTEHSFKLQPSGFGISIHRGD
jgi:hypothetical protein